MPVRDSKRVKAGYLVSWGHSKDDGDEGSGATDEKRRLRVEWVE